MTTGVGGQLTWRAWTSSTFQEKKNWSSGTTRCMAMWIRHHIVQEDVTNNTFKCSALTPPTTTRSNRLHRAQTTDALCCTTCTTTTTTTSVRQHSARKKREEIIRILRKAKYILVPTPISPWGVWFILRDNSAWHDAYHVLNTSKLYEKKKRKRHCRRLLRRRVVYIFMCTRSRGHHQVGHTARHCLNILNVTRENLRTAAAASRFSNVVAAAAYTVVIYLTFQVTGPKAALFCLSTHCVCVCWMWHTHGTHSSELRKWLAKECWLFCGCVCVCVCGSTLMQARFSIITPSKASWKW